MEERQKEKIRNKFRNKPTVIVTLREAVLLQLRRTVSHA
jgi:hypothetical protein